MDAEGRFLHKGWDVCDQPWNTKIFAETKAACRCEDPTEFASLFFVGKKDKSLRHIGRAGRLRESISSLQ